MGRNTLITLKNEYTTYEIIVDVGEAEHMWVQLSNYLGKEIH
jgi:hypothetical protein